MARNRMLNPDFWFDEELATISHAARLLYMGLWGICDDNYGTLPDRPDWIRAQVFPYEHEMKVRPLLTELEKIGKVVRFSKDEKSWLYVKNFLKHQKIDRPSKAKYPQFYQQKSPIDEHSTSPRTELKEVKEKKEGRRGAGVEKVGDILNKRKT